MLNIQWRGWCWGWRSNSLATWCEELTHWKDPDAGKDWSQGRREKQRTRWLDSTNSMGVSLRGLLQVVKDGEAWGAAAHGVAKSQTQLSDSTTAKQNVDKVTNLNIVLLFSCEKCLFKIGCCLPVYTVREYLRLTQCSLEIGWLWVTKCFERIVPKFLEVGFHTVCVFNSVKVTQVLHCFGRRNNCFDQTKYIYLHRYFVKKSEKSFGRLWLLVTKQRKAVIFINLLYFYS